MKKKAYIVLEEKAYTLSVKRGGYVVREGESLPCP
jgi:hypothetical protein